MRPPRMAVSQQSMALDVKIGECADDLEAVLVLGQSAIADMGEAEYPLDNQEGMLTSRPNFRLGGILRALHVRERTPARSPAVGHVLGGGCSSPDGFLLTLIGAVAPNLRLIAVKQITYHLAVMDIGRGHLDGVDNPLLAVDADMTLHAKIPLIALLGLVHLGITFALLVLGRGRGRDQGGVHDRARSDLEAIGLQMIFDRPQHHLAQPLFLDQMTELADRRLVRRS